MPKLTLSADREVIDKAKRLAAARGTSVSAMFSDYVQSIDEARRERRKSYPPKLREAIGLVKLNVEDRHKSYQQLRDEALTERFGL